MFTHHFKDHGDYAKNKFLTTFSLKQIPIIESKILVNTMQSSQVRTLRKTELFEIRIPNTAKFMWVNRYLMVG